MTSEQPELPYPEPGGQEYTAGHSGSDTSRERAVRERDDGTVSRRQTQTLMRLEMAGSDGLTWHELADAMGWHHGQASGVLSTLHMTDRIARLVLRRNRCHVYVLPENVNERPTQPVGGKAKVTDPDMSLEMALDNLGQAEAAIMRVLDICASWERATEGRSPAARVIRQAIEGKSTRQED